MMISLSEVSVASVTQRTVSIWVTELERRLAVIENLEIHILEVVWSLERSSRRK